MFASRVLLFCAVGCRLLSSAFADDDGSVSTDLEIVLPLSIRTEKVYHRDAKFGTPFSTQEVLGLIEYIDGDACNAASYANIKPQASTDLPRIYLVNRGECVFAHKTRLAQSHGGAAVIVVNNHCSERNRGKWGSSDLESKFCSSGYDDLLPFMAYDGGGQDITIPAFLIPKLQGQYLKNCYFEKLGKTSDSGYAQGLKLPNNDQSICNAATKIMVKGKLDIPVTGSNVAWEMWFKVDDLPEQIGLIADVAKAVFKQSTFTPSYIAFTTNDFGCDVTSCETLCLYKSGNLGQGYCMLAQPDSPLGTGVEILRESIRQVCLWEQAKANGQPGWFWDYLVALQADPKKSFNKESVTPGMDWSKVDKCMEQEAKSFSHFLEFQSATIKEKIFDQTLVVNSIRQDFGLTGLFVARAICDGYLPDSKPSMCKCVGQNDNNALLKCVQTKCFDDPKKQFNCPHSNKCVADLSECVATTDPGATSSGVSGLGVFLTVLTSCGIVAGVGFVYHKRARRAMQEEVRDMLSEYVPLEAFSRDGRGRRTSQDDTVGVI